MGRYVGEVFIAWAEPSCRGRSFRGREFRLKYSVPILSRARFTRDWPGNRRLPKRREVLSARSIATRPNHSPLGVVVELGPQLKKGTQERLRYLRLISEARGYCQLSPFPCARPSESDLTIGRWRDGEVYRREDDRVYRHGGTEGSSRYFFLFTASREGNVRAFGDEND